MNRPTSASGVITDKQVQGSVDGTVIGCSGSTVAWQLSYAYIPSICFVPPAKYLSMANNNTIPPDAILNPYTPLAFLTPSVANQYQLMLYVYVAILAVSFVKYQVETDLTSHTYRLTHGIGSWRFLRSTKLFERRESAGQILRISYRGS